MGRFKALRDRCRLEVAIVVVPLLAILVLQYVSSRRLAEVEVIAHQTTITRYLESVAADVRTVYEEAAREMLDVSGDDLAEKRFEEIGRHFFSMDTSTAKLLFAGTFDECLCLMRYYNPATGVTQIGADPDIELVVLRASTLVRFQRQRWLELEQPDFAVDEADPDNRVIYRFVADADANVIGFVGFVVDTDMFESEYLPRAISSNMGILTEDVQDNLIVRVSEPTGQVITATHNDVGQDDVLSARFDFIFRDWVMSARSRYRTVAQVVQSSAFTNWLLTVLMSVAVLGGVLLMWRTARRDRRLSRIRNAFVANVSHELRTPLASLAVFGEFLRRGRITSPQKIVEYGRQIEHESNRLRHLIDNVLDFARIESAAVTYRREDTLIEDVVGAAVRAVEVRREQDGFKISMSCADTVVPGVSVDPQAMTQVFVNLLDNAMKYSGRSRTVRIEIGQHDGFVAVRVADFGIGIAPDDHERIFQEFYRAGGAGDRGVVGTGLGLAIVRHVVQAHDGRVEVDSRLGRGSTFTVLLPAAGDLLHHVDGGEERSGLGALTLGLGRTWREAP